MRLLLSAATACFELTVQVVNHDTEGPLYVFELTVPRTLFDSNILFVSNNI